MSTTPLIEEVLKADSLFSRLCLPVKKASRDELKKKFKELAVQVHPDKCNVEKAKEAFQLIVAAYETLCDVHSQHREILRVTKNKGKDYEFLSGTGQCEGWCNVSWTVFEKSFQERERLELELRKEFICVQSAKFVARQIRTDINRTEKAVRTLDEQNNIEMHALWPRRDAHENLSLSEGVLDDKELSYQLTDEEMKERLVDLLLYLRKKHCYCFYCGIVFTDSVDLENKCPGIFELHH